MFLQKKWEIKEWIWFLTWFAIWYGLQFFQYGTHNKFQHSFSGVCAPSTVLIIKNLIFIIILFSLLIYYLLSFLVWWNFVTLVWCTHRNSKLQKFHCSFSGHLEFPLILIGRPLVIKLKFQIKYKHSEYLHMYFK